jgi:hypothetical protein
VRAEGAHTRGEARGRSPAFARASSIRPYS